MINDIKDGIKLATGLVGLAKNIKELSDDTGNLELKEAAVELRSQTIDLKGTVNDMRDMIISLEEQLAFKTKLNWNGKTFDYKENEKTVFICNGCHANAKIVRMTEDKRENGYHSASCPVCKNLVVFNNGSISTWKNKPTRRGYR